MVASAQLAPAQRSVDTLARGREAGFELADILAQCRDEEQQLADRQRRLQVDIATTRQQLQDGCSHVWKVDRLGSFHNTVFGCDICGAFC